MLVLDNGNFWKFYYGRFYTKNRTKDEIKKDLETALTLFTAQGKEGQAYHTQGHLYRFDKEWKKAIQAYDQALRINLDDVEAYIGISYL